ncbi:hypothetical protein BDZ45DRAFT_2154 [Acephala macrosclerotiorum]|nr:hypothetical protein BDZ45DRAFT_2154 [Acephala macrosclerotiorum]
MGLDWSGLGFLSLRMNVSYGERSIPAALCICMLCSKVLRMKILRTNTFMFSLFMMGENLGVIRVPVVGVGGEVLGLVGGWWVCKCVPSSYVGLASGVLRGFEKGHTKPVPNANSLPNEPGIISLCFSGCFQATFSRRTSKSTPLLKKYKTTTN